MASKYTWDQVYTKAKSLGVVPLNLPPSSKNPIERGHSREWKFRCFCGNEFGPGLYNFITQTSRGCGCVQTPRRTKKYTERHLDAICLALGLTWLEGNRSPLGPLEVAGVYTFRCKCGQTFSPPLQSVLMGHTKSCGCLQSTRAAEHCRIMNRKLGFDHLELIAAQAKVKVLDEDPWRARPPRSEAGPARVRLQCRCGKDFHPVRGNFLQGKIKTCGCLKAITQKELLSEVKGWMPGTEVIENATGVLPGRQQVDIWVPFLRLGIEYHGLWWHREEIRGKDYHRKKWESAKAAGVRLIQVFEDEWLGRPDAVRGFLRSVIGAYDHRIGARKLSLELKMPWSDVKGFLETSHVFGSGPPGWTAALLDDDKKPVAAIVCRKRKLGWELTRYAVAPGWRIAGGFDRLWTAFIKAHNPKKVVSFSDRRWSEGGLYLRAGFAYDGETKPTYWYARESRRTRYHKSNFRKARIEQKLGPLQDGETESQAMSRFGWYKVWDCGLDRWVWSQSTKEQTSPDLVTPPSLGVSI